MEKSNLLLTVLILCGLVSCKAKFESEAFNHILHKKNYSVLLFFAPDCPLCHTFSKPFNELTVDNPDIQFIAIQSGLNYDPMEIKMFKEETGLIALIFIDKDYSVAHKFNAGITPEFFLVDSTGKVLYQGLLDDRMKALGVYKQQWGVHYLKNAIAELKAGKAIKIPKTSAVGCDLEY